MQLLSYPSVAKSTTHSSVDRRNYTQLNFNLDLRITHTEPLIITPNNTQCLTDHLTQPA